MELGRWDLALRMGLAKVMLRERCVGILGGQAIQYKKPLKRFRTFDLRVGKLPACCTGPRWWKCSV